MAKYSLLVPGILAAGLVYYFGYWENLPLLERISGPIRFRERIADPVPEGFSDIRGGYSGFPQGVVVTQFTFAKDPAEWGFLSAWSPASKNAANKFEFYVPELQPTAIYERSDDSLCRHVCYLAVNENTRRGALVAG